MNVLVMGLAKTGTTIIAKTIQQSMADASFLMEPLMLDPFLAPPEGNTVAKIIFEHWSDRPYSRLAILNNELGLKFDRKIFIMRDPRDELISRMFYYAYSFILEKRGDRHDLGPWLEKVRQKEQDPGAVTVREMLATLSKMLSIDLSMDMTSTFQYFHFIDKQREGAYALRYEDFIAGKLQGLEDYLGLSLIRERDVGTELQRTRRTAGYNNWKEFFLQSDLDAFYKLHRDEMSIISYADWELAPVSSLNPEHGSEYIERLITDAEQWSTDATVGARRLSTKQ